jgi:(2Fe-2S) ferredoxin
MVHKLAAMVAELHTLPAYDGGAIAERVRAWYRFVDVVAAGHVAPDALPLASEVIRLGVRFLEAHPEQVLVGGAVWSVADVEAVATWYGGVDDRSAPDVVERVAAFAAVVRAGLVDDDAKALAEALFEVMHAPR